MIFRMVISKNGKEYTREYSEDVFLYPLTCDGESIFETAHPEHGKIPFKQFREMEWVWPTH